jgi:hypothetical protein
MCGHARLQSHLNMAADFKLSQRSLNWCHRHTHTLGQLCQCIHACAVSTRVVDALSAVDCCCVCAVMFQVGPEGAIALAAALKVNPVLSYLNLSGTSIGVCLQGVRSWVMIDTIHSGPLVMASAR